MNIKIDNGHLRFKIDEDELGRLLAGESIIAEARIGAVTLRGMIVPEDSEGEPEPALVLASDAATLFLHVPVAAVQALSAMGRSREGIEVARQELAVTLQVDVRGDKRRRNEG